MAKIFLCHANEDKPQIEEIYRRLRDKGFQPWMDKIDLVPGQRWDREIRNALKASDFILIFFSQNSVVKRGYVQREFKLALDILQEMPENFIHIIPVRLDDCTIPEQFGFLHWCNLFERDGFQRLVQAIHMGLSQRQQSESEVLTQKILETVSPPRLAEQQANPISPGIETPQYEKRETLQEYESPTSRFPPRTTFQQYTHQIPVQHKTRKICDALKNKLPHINKYIFFSIFIGLFLVFIGLFLVFRSEIFLKSDNPSTNVLGVYLQIDVKSGEKITGDIIEIQGDTTRIPKGQPIAKEDVIGFCAINTLQKGTRLTLKNIGSCTN